MYDLGRQVNQRIRKWKEELKNHLYTPVGTVSFEYCIAEKALTAAEAEEQPRLPAPVGMPWGKKWEYAWFTADVTLDEAAAGRRVVLFSGTGGEQLVYVNGRAAGSIDRQHAYVTLTRNAVPGERFHVQIESYAGHGLRLEELGPWPEERPVLPEVTEPQCVVGESVLAVWNEDAYQLWLDVETLDSLQQALGDNSLRALRTAEALKAFTHIADFELPEGEREESFRAAREALKPVLACVNGTTAPVMWLLGQSHIDLGWLWPLEETRHKSVRTYANQLALMEEYPEYRFLLCEPALLDLLRKQDPEVWDRVRQAVREGKMTPEGAFYVECDTNIPSGESLIRQVLTGKAWFREQLGVKTTVAWQPDTFGFSAALPQILKQAGIRYFATEKLLRADPETERFPYQNFIWEGMDGSTVEALSFFKANAPVSPALLQKRWDAERSQRENIDTQLYTFGYGDGGGGADRDTLEMIRRVGDLEGVPRTRWGTLPEFFEETSRQAVRNRWTGELYLAWHRGTYSVQRRQKAAMRRAEEALRETEALAARLSPKERVPLRHPIREAWQTLLLNQFHDIAGGVGIARVHQEATEALVRLTESLETLNGRLRQMAYHIQPGPGLVLVNPLNWDRSGWVELPDGREIYAEVPAGGAVNAEQAERPLSPEEGVTASEEEDGIHLKNDRLEAVADRQGRIVSLRLRGADGTEEFLCPGQVMNDWRLYRNIQTVYDAWELDRDWPEERLEGAVQAEARLTLNTPACAEITVALRFGRSTARQRIRLRAREEQLTFETEVNWQERRKMLKVHFESNLICEDAVHEIQFGFVRRPCHRSHPFARDRYEVSNHRYSALCETGRGFALLNDGLYGLSTGRGEMALTLLRAPLVPDDGCDRGEHRFTYALRPFDVPFCEAELARAGYELNQPVRATEGQCVRQEGFTCESRGILTETVKPAENGEGTILRLYESLGTAERGVLKLPFEAVVRTASLEEKDGETMGTGREFPVSFRPFEIQTLRVIPVRPERKNRPGKRKRRKWLKR